MVWGLGLRVEGFRRLGIRVQSLGFPLGIELVSDDLARILSENFQTSKLFQSTFVPGVVNIDLYYTN